MDGSVHTVVETVKKLGDTLRDCFENDTVAFVLVGQAVLPEVNKIAPPLHFEYDINDYGDVTFILNEFKKRYNVYYKMHLMEAYEEIYKRQTVTDKVKAQINGENNIYEAVPYGVEGNACNYIVKKIKIPNNSFTGFTYRFMNIFEIIDQYRVAPRQSGNDELDSRLEDFKNIDIDIDGVKPKKRSHDSDTDSYASIESTTNFYSKK
jgi:hypothetical protein